MTVGLCVEIAAVIHLLYIGPCSTYVHTELQPEPLKGGLRTNLHAIQSASIIIVH